MAPGPKGQTTASCTEHPLPAQPSPTRRHPVCDAGWESILNIRPWEGRAPETVVWGRPGTAAIQAVPQAESQVQGSK